MNNTLVALVVSASLLACGGKKDNTTPVNKGSIQHRDDGAGGAAYGGAAYGEKRASRPAKDAANPCAPK